MYVRDGDVVTKSKRSKSESALLLTTEFNYQYRVHDPVWLSYKEPGDDAPKETPVIISGFSVQAISSACARARSVRGAGPTGRDQHSSVSSTEVEHCIIYR